MVKVIGLASLAAVGVIDAFHALPSVDLDKAITNLETLILMKVIVAAEGALNVAVSTKLPANAYDPNGAKAPGRPEDAEGFTPTIRIAYRLDKFRNLQQQTDTMVRLTAVLLENFPGDAALTWDLEQVWLLRCNGELTLNERDDLWTPRRLAFIPLPYRRATYSFSDE